MIRKNKLLILAGIVAIALIATPVFSIYYDFTAMNALIRGYLTVQNAASFSESVTHAKAEKLTKSEVAWVAGTGFTVTPTGSYSCAVIDVADATISSANNGDIVNVFGGGLTGATVVVSTPTSATNGAVLDIVYESSDSGTTPLVIVGAGLEPLFTATGVTNSVLNADGENLRIMWNYIGTSGVSYFNLKGAAT